MKTASISIYEELQKRGYRVTAPRKKIIEALLTASAPKTAKEIALHTKIKDLSTVYRTLSELVKEAFIEEFTHRGTSYFEISNHHHDHAVCVGCGVIVHIPCSQLKAPQALGGWKELSHEALWRGRCGACV